MGGFKIMIIELMIFMLQMIFYISIYINTVALFITIKVDHSANNDQHPGSKMTPMFHIIEQTRL